MLTFEHYQDIETLEIHADLKGLRELCSTLSRLIESSEKTGTNHDHLMTEDWGGSELSNEKLGDTSTLVHHVKIFCWCD